MVFLNILRYTNEAPDLNISLTQRYLEVRDMHRALLMCLGPTFSASIIIALIISYLTRTYALEYVHPTYTMPLMIVLMFTPMISSWVACRLTGDKLTSHGLMKVGKIEKGLKFIVTLMRIYVCALREKGYTLMSISYIYVLLLLNVLLHVITFGKAPDIATNLEEIIGTLMHASSQVVDVRSELMLMIIMSPIVGGLVNMLPALGEEICWRGYLLDLIKDKVGSWLKASMLIGIIWGLWHAPHIVLYGFNYGYQYPQMEALEGAMLFTIFCMIFSVFLSWLRIRTDNVLLPAMAHGAYNGSAGLLMVSYWTGDTLTSGCVGVEALVVMVILDIAVLAYDKMAR